MWTTASVKGQQTMATMKCANSTICLNKNRTVIRVDEGDVSIRSRLTAAGAWIESTMRPMRAGVRTRIRAWSARRSIGVDHSPAPAVAAPLQVHRSGSNGSPRPPLNHTETTMHPYLHDQLARHPRLYSDRGPASGTESGQDRLPENRRGWGRGVRRRGESRPLHGPVLPHRRTAGKGLHFRAGPSDVRFFVGSD